MWFLFVILTVFKLFEFSCELDAANDTKLVSINEQKSLDAFSLDAIKKVQPTKPNNSKDGYATEYAPLMPVIVAPSASNIMQCNFGGNFLASCYADNPKCLAEEKLCYHVNSICCYRETQVVPILSVPQYIFDSPQLPNTITRKPSRIVYANECIFKKPLQMYCKPYRAPNTPKNKCEFGEKLCIIRKFRQTCCYKELNYQTYGNVQTVSVQKIGFKMYCFESVTGRKCPGNYQILYTPFGINCCYRKNEEKSLTPLIPSSIWSSLKSVFTLVDLCYATPIQCENFFFSVKVPGIDIWCCVSVSISGPTPATIEGTTSQPQDISSTTDVQSTTERPYYFCNTTSTTTEKTFDPYDLIDIRNLNN